MGKKGRKCLPRVAGESCCEAMALVEQHGVSEVWALQGTDYRNRVQHVQRHLGMPFVRSPESWPGFSYVFNVIVLSHTSSHVLKQMKCISKEEVLMGSFFLVRNQQWILPHFPLSHSSSNHCTGIYRFINIVSIFSNPTTGMFYCYVSYSFNFKTFPENTF